MREVSQVTLAFCENLGQNNKQGVIYPASLLINNLILRCRPLLEVSSKIFEQTQLTLTLPLTHYQAKGDRILHKRVLLVDSYCYLF
jgi:hypothetical protein